jgi:hypothetical protein
LSKTPDKLTPEQLAARGRRNWILFAVHLVLAALIFLAFYQKVTAG